MNIKDLSPNPWNPRKISDTKLAMLKKSLDKFGDLSGFVFNRRTNKLISGHQRQKSLPPGAITITDFYDAPTRCMTVREGFALIDGEKFKYREVDADTTWETEAMIAANKHGGEWDAGLLHDAVALTEGLNLEITGFDIKEIEALNIPQVSLPGEENAPKTNDEEKDEIPDPPKKIQTTKGQLIELGPHLLMCGDCTNEEDLKKLLGEKIPRLCFTSPPYSDQRDYGGDLNLKPAHLAKFLMAPSTIYAVNLGLKRQNHEIVPYWEEYLAFARNLGLKLLSWNVWDKMGAGTSLGQMNAMFPVDHEWLFVFGKKPIEIEPTEDCKWAGLSHAPSKQRQVNGSLQTAPERFVVNEKKRMSTVTHQAPYKARNEDLGNHPGVFPPALPEKYIAACTKENDWVYDPFAGSGSTLIATERLGRRALLMEINPAYCDTIITRYNNYLTSRGKSNTVQHSEVLDARTREDNRHIKATKKRT